jgi:hypothetical protein
VFTGKDSETVFKQVYRFAQWRFWRLNNNPALTWHFLRRFGYYNNDVWLSRNITHQQFPDKGHTLHDMEQWAAKTFERSLFFGIPQSIYDIPHRGVLEYENSDEGTKWILDSLRGAFAQSDRPEKLDLVIAAINNNDPGSVLNCLIRLSINVAMTCLYLGYGVAPVALVGTVNKDSKSVKTQHIADIIHSVESPEVLPDVQLDQWVYEDIRFSTYNHRCIAHVLLKQIPAKDTPDTGTPRVSNPPAATGNPKPAAAGVPPVVKPITIKNNKTRFAKLAEFAKKIVVTDTNDDSRTSYTCILDRGREEFTLAPNFSSVKFPFKEIKFYAKSVTNLPYVKTASIKNNTKEYKDTEMLYARPMTTNIKYGVFADMNASDRLDGDRYTVSAPLT